MERRSKSWHGVCCARFIETLLVKEEQERLTDHYRDGVYKALAVKKKVEEKVICL